MAEKIESADIEKQTSMGAYLGKQLYQQVVTWGSLAGGAYAGALAAVKSAGKAVVSPEAAAEWKRLPFVSKLPGLKEVSNVSRVQWGAGIGAFAGMLVAGTLLGYEHWKKIKQSQLQVDELTKDISDIEVFKKTDPELKAENTRLWAELKKRDGATSMVEKVGATKKQDWKETAQADAGEQAQASR